MTHKNSIYAVLVTMLFAAILAKCREALDKHAPVGYEDESGFHYGKLPMGKSND
jgi:hypothetical protein